MIYVAGIIIITALVALVVALYYWYDLQLNRDDDEGDTLNKFMSEW